MLMMKKQLSVFCTYRFTIVYITSAIIVMTLGFLISNFLLGNHIAILREMKQVSESIMTSIFKSRFASYFVRLHLRFIQKFVLACYSLCISSCKETENFCFSKMSINIFVLLQNQHQGLIIPQY